MQNDRKPRFPAQAFDFAISAFKETMDFVEREVGSAAEPPGRQPGAGPFRRPMEEPPPPPPGGHAAAQPPPRSPPEEDALFTWTMAPGRTVKITVSGGVPGNPAEVEEILDTIDRLVEIKRAQLAKAKAAPGAARRRPADPRD